MKKLLCTLVCFVMVLGIFAVDAFAAKKDSKDVDWGLTLMADEVTPTGMVVVMDQSKVKFKGQLEYCECFSLQVCRDGAWIDVQPINPSFGCLLSPDNVALNAKTRMLENWEDLYGALPVGQYRYIKEFTNFDGDDPEQDVSVDYFVEFAITEPHTCRSEDQDMACDVCLSLMPHTCKNSKGSSKCKVCAKTMDVYRVVGNADWMGNWDLQSDAGRMTEIKSEIFEKTFPDVPPGEYELRVTKNGSMDEGLSDKGENYCFTLEKSTDVTVVVFARDGSAPLLRVNGVYVGLSSDDESSTDNPKTADLSAGYVVALLSCSAAALLLLLHRKKEVL